ncbi:hypothetical protein [Paenibacillus gorillae]|uniref:hypothetical protein n=1 Tax=Paenibacillus gorillae TaxID=1243662 RepID=UPI0004B502D6|nr:hypothetical protein [Paenibacillus gorillae]
MVVPLYQAGEKDTSEDRKKLLWNETPAGSEASIQTLINAKEHKVGINDFYTDDSNVFKTARAAINVGGSYRLGSLKEAAYCIATTGLK